MGLEPSQFFMIFGRQNHMLLLALLFSAISSYGWHIRTKGTGIAPTELADRVVVPAPLQVLLTAGDRFLAADVEAIRVLATESDALDAVADNLSFGIRARKEVSYLNPCHEDNYYFANALLTWGGAASHGNEVLRRATECRVWDEYPPFFYGFSLYYFDRDLTKATQALNEAANRSPNYSAPLRKLAIMLVAENIEDDAVALTYLESERDKARDAKLRETLNKRVVRLQGLIALKQAQADYEQRFKKKLTDPQLLIESGIIKSLPTDPTRIGYEFIEGRFRMREVQVSGLENRKK